MRIKLDENLPASLAASLHLFGHDVHTTEQEGLAGKPDPDIWSAAQREARFLITQDLDFSHFRAFSPGSHHGILLVRLRSPRRDSLIRRVEEIFTTEQVESWQRCFVVATEHKIRVKYPRNNG